MKLSLEKTKSKQFKQPAGDQAVHCSVTAASASRDGVLSDRCTILKQFRLILISSQKFIVINDVFQSSE